MAFVGKNFALGVKATAARTRFSGGSLESSAAISRSWRRLRVSCSSSGTPEPIAGALPYVLDGDYFGENPCRRSRQAP